MAVSFVVLYNCLVRGLIVQPTGSVYFPQAEDKPAQGWDLFGQELRTNSASVQMLSCLYGFSQIAGTPKPTADIYADRRVSFGTVDEFSQNGLDIDEQDSNRKPSSSTEADFLTGYPPAQRPPTLQTAKRNCHIIKCPKFSQTTYGSDGGRCYEFVNPCFLAVASCKRHNNRLPRLREVSRKQCDTLIRQI